MRIKLVLAVMVLWAVAVQAQQTNGLEDFQSMLQKQEGLLLDGYGKALGDVMLSLKQKGAIESYLAVDVEAKRFEAERTVGFTSDVKVVFYSAMEGYWKGRIVLLKKYVAALDGLVKAEMLADRIVGAKAAKEERDRYAFELADIEARMPKPVVKVVEKDKFRVDRKLVSSGAVGFDGHSYLVFLEKKTWHEAKFSCENSGGHLVVISSRRENDFVKKMVGMRILWMGLFMGEHGKFEWVDGTKMMFEDWGKGQPMRVASARYVAIGGVGDKSWSSGDTGSSVVDGYVCEWDY